MTRNKLRHLGRWMLQVFAMLAIAAIWLWR
jgi:hypothetical protein